MSNTENFFGGQNILDKDSLDTSLIASLDNSNILLGIKPQESAFSDPFNQEIEPLSPVEKAIALAKDKQNEDDHSSLFPRAPITTGNNISAPRINISSEVDSLSGINSETPVFTEPEVLLGDADRDCDIDYDDVDLITAARNTKATGTDDPRDMDRDGKITVLDSRKLIVILKSNTDFIPPELSQQLANDTAPEGTTNNDGITSDITIAGTLTDTSDVFCLKAVIDDTPIEQFTNIISVVDENGNFTLNAHQLAVINKGIPLSEGEHTLYLQAKDKWANETELTSITFTLDTLPPELTVNQPTDNGEITTGARLIGTVNEDLASLVYRFGDGQEIAVAVNEQREFNQALNLEGIALGEQTITIIATDLAGNETTSSLSVNLVREDGVVPIVNAALKNDTGASNTDRLTLDPTITGEIESDRLITSLQGSLNGGSFIDISDALNDDGTFTLSLEQYEVLSNGSLPDGNYTVALRAIDNGGQASTPVNVTFTLDRTPPPLTLELAPESDTGTIGDGRTTRRNVNLVGQSDPNQTVILVETQQSVTADSQGNFTFTNVPMPRAGEAAFTVVATDLAGNQGRLREEFIRDGVNGAPTITSSPDLTFDTTQQETYTYQVVATDPDRDPLTYTLLNAPEGAEIDENGLISFTPSGILQPFYDFTIEVSDGRGGTDTQAFTVELTNISNVQGEIRGTKWNDLNGNGFRDTQLVQGNDPDVIFTIDVSGSADFPFAGTSIGDINEDGLINTRLDAELASFIALNNQLVEQGLGQKAEVGIVVFSGFAAQADMNLVANGLQLVTTPTADINNNGIADVEEILRSIVSGAFGVGNDTGTNFEVALQRVENSFTSLGTAFGDGNVVFLSDGEITAGGLINDEVDRLNNNFGANLSAFGVGQDASLSSLQIIDPNAQIFTTTDELLGVFGGFGSGEETFIEPGLAGVSVYLDANNNGVFDFGEPIQVTSEDDPNTTDIDETGQYEFTNLLPGTYTVREIVPQGFEQTFPLGSTDNPGDGYADVILEYFAAGNSPSPIPEPYGSNGNGILEPVDPSVVLGAPPPGPIIGSNPEVDWLAIPQGSYVTVGFTDETVIDAPGDDIFIRSFDPQDSADENADVFVSSNGIDFEFLGTVNEQGLVALDLADIGFTKPVTAVRVVGLDNRGTSPGFDLIGVEVLPGSIANPGFYTVDLEVGEIVDNIDFGNVQKNAEIRGTKWEDIDGDGVRDNNEPGLAGTTVYLDLNNNGVQDANEPSRITTTDNPNTTNIDETGQYQFTELIAGTYTVREVVPDGFDQTAPGSQQYTVNLDPGEIVENINFGNIRTGTNNLAPVIITDPITTAVPNTPYRYQVRATDANGDSLTYTLANAPDGMEINSNGLITWNPSALGAYAVAVEASDGRGGIATQNYSINVTEVIADTEAPEVRLGFSGTVIELGETLNLQVAATDNVGVEDIDLLFNGTPVTLNPDNPNQINTASITLNQAGVFEILATATDASGNVGTKTLQVRVVDPNDNQAPFVEIDPTQFNSASPVITDLTDLLGTVTDDNLEFYRVDIAPVSLVNLNNPGELDADYTTIATGNSNVVSNALGQIDPFILRNDSYFVRVYAQDFSGNIGVQGLVLGVDTQTKPGEFSLDFTDLTIPLTGIPIEITRNYSSLDAKFQGDFGYGWSLGLQDAGIQESVPVSDLELQGVPALFGGSDPFQVGTRIYLNTPEGRRVGFTFDPIAQGGIFGTIWRPRFRPDPGVYETLQVEDVSLQQYADGTFGLYLFGLPYNPRDYQLTTRDGTVYNYDQFEGLETVRDRNNNTLTFTDDGITSSTGEEIDFVRDAQGRITEITDPAGESIIYEYDAEGDLVGVSDRTENETTFKYEDERPHYLTEVIDPLGRSGTRTEYDDEGNISRIIDADGNAIELDFDSATKVQTLTDPFGNNTTFFFDDRGNVVREIDAEGGETTRTYDNNNNIVTETDARGNTTRFTYDDKGNILTQTDALGNTTTSTYNQFSQLLTQTDALGDVTTNQYDANGNLLQTTDAEGNITTYNYDSFGNLIQTTDASGNITQYAYDPFGRVNQITDADGGITNLAYDRNGNVTSITTPLGNTTIFVYDDENRLTRITDALGNVSTIEYNNAGQRSATVDALGRRTEFIYSDRGLLTQIRYADGTVETFTYDELDRQIATSDRNGNQTQFQYDGVGDLIGVIDALNQQTTYERDAEGNLIRQTDALGRTTTFVYDALDRLISTTLPLGQETTNTYDAVGNLIRTEDFNGGVLEYDYDRAGNLTQISTANGTVLEQYDYTPTGQVERIQDERGVTLFEYDGLDRIIKRTDPDGRTIAYTYDADGNVDTLITASGTVDYNYDALGRLDTVTDRDGTVTDYDYDAVGNLIETSFANGVTETREYDLNNRVEQLTTTNSNGTVLASYEYTFDNVGNRLSVTENTGRVTQYAYDDLYRVTEEQITDPTLGNDTTSYEYNAVGDRLSKTDANGETTYVYDNNDRLVREENNGQVITYNYDDAGNLLDQRINGIIVEAYDWNIQGEMIRATVNNGGTTTTAEYEYNTDGIRVSKTVNGVETRFLIDDVQQQFDQVIEEYSPSGLIQVVYTHGLDLIGQTRGSDKSYYHTDSLGTVRLLTDNLGNVVNRYLYDAYGNILTQSEVQQNSYKFTGEQFDPELNSYYQRARYYNPNTGRFTSRDSFEGFLERPLSLNKYSYTEGNPINAIDPSGKITFLERAIFFVPVGISLFGIIQASQECIDPYSPLISPTNPVVDFTNNFIASQICETLRTVTNALKQVNQ